MRSFITPQLFHTDIYIAAVLEFSDLKARQGLAPIHHQSCKFSLVAMSQIVLKHTFYFDFFLSLAIGLCQLFHFFVSTTGLVGQEKLRKYIHPILNGDFRKFPAFEMNAPNYNYSFIQIYGLVVFFTYRKIVISSRS